MKRRLVILSIGLLCLAAVILMFYPFAKTPATPETFMQVMREKEYIVVEQDYHGGISFSAQKQWKSGLFIFTVFDSETDAVASYTIHQSMLESTFGDSASHKATSGQNYDSYRITSSDDYYRVCRVENTVLVVASNKEYKRDIDAIFRKLGY